jgi:hypothetical protein
MSLKFVLIAAVVACTVIALRKSKTTNQSKATGQSERNPYGDELKSSREGFGSDVSSQRLTPFEEEILERAAQLKQTASETPSALDLFSGFCAANGLRLAQLDFTAYAVDFSPPDQSLETTAERPLPSGGILHYFEQDVRDLSFLKGKLDLVTCQRGLHFLRYEEARTLVANLAERLKPGASMFFSIGAVDCAVGPGYKHADLPVAQRWHPLEPELGSPIHVTQPLCLYKQEDIESLFAGLDGKLVTVGRDDFGLFIVEFKMN